METITPHHTDTIVFTDIGRDSDDTFALIVGRRLRELYGSRMEAVVTTLTPAFNRARLALWTLDQLGISARVAGGSDLPDISAESAQPYEFAMVPENYGTYGRVWEPEKALETVFSDPYLEDHSLNLVVISGFTELAKEVDRCARDPRLLVRFKRKIDHLVIMGGILTEDGKPVLDEDGLLQIDSSANYEFDREAARRVIQFAQINHIPMRFVSRHTAYAAKLPRDSYVKAGQTENKAGMWLEDAVASGFRSLWERANLPSDAPNRALPARCDRNWFIQTFCGGQEIPSREDPWEFITGIAPYDPLAMLATSPELMAQYFAPVTVDIYGTKHEIVGLSPDMNGVKDPEALKQFLTEMLIDGLRIPRAIPERTYSGEEVEALGVGSIRVSGYDDPCIEAGPDSVFVRQPDGRYVKRSYTYGFPGADPTITE